MTQVSVAVDSLHSARTRRPTGDTRAEGRAVNSPPLLKAKASQTDLWEAIERVHSCLHAQHEETGRQFERLHDRISSVDDKVDDVALKVAFMQGAAEAQARALGVAVPAVQSNAGVPAAEEIKGFRTIATLKPWKAVAGLMGAAAATVVGYRILAALAPPVWTFLLSVHEILMKVATS